MVGYYRAAAGVSSVCVSSRGVICEWVCLVMSFLEGGVSGRGEMSQVLRRIPFLCAWGRDRREAHLYAFNRRGMPAGVRRVWLGEPVALRCCNTCQSGWQGDWEGG